MSWLIKAIENTIIEPRCRQVVIGKSDIEKGESLSPLICMEHAIVPIQGFLRKYSREYKLGRAYS